MLLMLTLDKKDFHLYSFYILADILKPLKPLKFPLSLRDMKIVKLTGFENFTKAESKY